jgi:hypothetical protein
MTFAIAMDAPVQVELFRGILGRSKFFELKERGEIATCIRTGRLCVTPREFARYLKSGNAPGKETVEDHSNK